MRAAEQVLRIPRRIRRAPARRNQDVADVVARENGLLQPAEIAAYDKFIAMRAGKETTTDSRVAVVEITENGADPGTSRRRSRRWEAESMMRKSVYFAALIAAVAFSGAARAQATSLDSTATLLWTAPGDDGTAGRATRYEMRFRSAPILAMCSGWNL